MELLTALPGLPISFKLFTYSILGLQPLTLSKNNMGASWGCLMPPNALCDGGHHGGNLMPPKLFFLRTKTIFPMKCIVFPRTKITWGASCAPMMSPIMGGIRHYPPFIHHPQHPSLAHHTHHHSPNPPPPTPTPPPPIPHPTPLPPPTYGEKVGP